MANNTPQPIAVKSSNPETVYILIRPFWVTFLPWILLGLSFIIVGVVFSIFVDTAFPELATGPGRQVLIILTAAFLLIIIPIITVAFIDYYFDLDIVTNRRIINIDQQELFSRHVSELSLTEIEDVSVRTAGILASVLDFGDVLIQTAGTKNEFAFERILHPQEVSEIILDLADQAKTQLESGEGVAGIEIAPQGAAKGIINDYIYHSLEDLHTVSRSLSQNINRELGFESVPENDVPPPQPPAPGENTDALIGQPAPSGRVSANNNKNASSDVIIDEPEP